MMRKIFFSMVWFIFIASMATADTIEIKGKGFFSGTILKDQEDGIDFEDSYGQLRHFSKSELIYVEKERTHLKGLSLSSAKDSLSFMKKAASKTKSGLSHALESAKTPGAFDNWLDSHLGYADRINAYINQWSQSALDFLFREQAVEALIKNVEARITSIKSYKSDNLFVGGLGMAVMFFGALAFVVFWFRLISDAFERHFLWGVAFLAIPLSCAVPLVGASFGFLVMAPYFASLCFIVIHWRVARAAFVAQIFSVNVILLGFFIFQMAS